MSTFAVFGMSENWAREEARENTSTQKTVDGKRLERTIREWEEAVEAQVAKIMAGKKCVRLSPFFDAPPVRPAVHGDGAPKHHLPRPTHQDESCSGRCQGQANHECKGRSSKSWVC